MGRYISVISFLLVLVVAAGMISCDRDKSILNIPYDTAEMEFPNEIGFEWTYFYYDSLNAYADTVQVTIVGEIEFNEGRIAKIWEYRFKTKVDTKYVEILGDTVRIYRDLNSLWLNTKFVFPLYVGKGWKGDRVSDTSEVVEKTSIDLNGKPFNPCYIIQEYWGVANDYGWVTTWFVPHVGIVKQHYRGESFGKANVYWELLDHNFE